ncbi:unnamed protein product [Dimorphilus gyrociliatus]|uniref:Uncharacterized protein n=1 Tax=Dimorphilus gyrociliatus TaxID=2664684 RepID=A0A7I8VH03_9ANNE|nr:unnamed protein product [Dimorphilus gyrociliatus]
MGCSSSKTPDVVSIQRQQTPIRDAGLLTPRSINITGAVEWQGNVLANNEKTCTHSIQYSSTTSFSERQTSDYGSGKPHSSDNESSICDDTASLGTSLEDFGCDEELEELMRANLLKTRPGAAKRQRSFELTNKLE